jgi:hypothetical protein
MLAPASGMVKVWDDALNFSNVLREQGRLTGNFLVDRESLAYMTPKRFYRDPVTAATDQYSLALLATELLSGQALKRAIHPSGPFADLPRYVRMRLHFLLGEGQF